MKENSEMSPEGFVSSKKRDTPVSVPVPARIRAVQSYEPIGLADPIPPVQPPPPED
jgi:hypothetical protein